MNFIVYTDIRLISRNILLLVVVSVCIENTQDRKIMFGNTDFITNFDAF